MTFDHADMISRLVRHYRRINRGSDGLSPDALPPFSRDEITELRRLSGNTTANSTRSAVERVGGVPSGERPEGGWFREAETAWKS